MLICLTGFDKSGKTTQANKLIKEFPNLQYYRSTHQKDKKTNLEEAIKHDWRFFLDIAQQVDFNLLFDRCFIDQFVYSQIYRLDNIFNHFNSINEYQNLFENYCKILANIEHLIIYFYKENQNIIEDDFIDVTKVYTVLKKFDEFFNLFEKYLNVIFLKFEDGIEYNFKKIKEQLIK
jgi:tRNA uridine 5-carbamoylmethylation protein Kti12